MALSIMKEYSFNMYWSLALYHRHRQKTKTKQWWPFLWVLYSLLKLFSYSWCFTNNSTGRSRAISVTLSILECTISIEIVVKNSDNADDFHKLSLKTVKAKVRFGCGLLLLMNIGTWEDINVSFKTHSILQLTFKASFPELLAWVSWPWFYWLNFYSSSMNNLSYEQ